MVDDWVSRELEALLRVAARAPRSAGEQSLMLEVAEQLRSDGLVELVRRTWDERVA
jgi:hypothetical protein